MTRRAHDGRPDPPARGASRAVYALLAASALAVLASAAVFTGHASKASLFAAASVVLPALLASRRATRGRLRLTFALVVVGDTAMAVVLRERLPLAVVGVACASILLWAGIGMPRRATRRVLYIGLIGAVLAVAITATFYSRPPPPLTELTLWPNVTGPHRTVSVQLQLTGHFRGCSRAVVFHPVIRFRTGALAATPARYSLRVGTGFVHARTLAELGHLPNGSPAAQVTATDLTIAPTFRGIGSCFLQLPRLVGGGSPVPAAAETDLDLGGASVRVDRGATPDFAGSPSRWLCRSPVDHGYAQLGYRADCRAVVVLTDSWYRLFENLMLLGIGTLLATLAATLLQTADDLQLPNGRRSH
jgi:hypothetical protein